MSEPDWRLQGQERFLNGRRVRWREWRPSREGWEHDHCAFCWAKISDRPVGDDTAYNVAWVTADDDYHWICPTCFDDFRSRFGWMIESE